MNAFIGIYRAFTVLGALALCLLACGRTDVEDRVVPIEWAEIDHPIEVLAGNEPMRLRTETEGVDGTLISVRCGTCHSLLEEVPSLFGAALTFHTGIEITHGELSCNSCHGEGDREHLRLADGVLIAGEESIELCSQCHGPQRRDYDHGSHGGMMGHWDLAIGPRQRNRCGACHAPHDPAFPSLMPAPGPQDRFLDGITEHRGDSGSPIASRRTGHDD